MEYDSISNFKYIAEVSKDGNFGFFVNPYYHEASVEDYVPKKETNINFPIIPVIFLVVAAAAVILVIVLQKKDAAAKAEAKAVEQAKKSARKKK